MVLEQKQQEELKEVLFEVCNDILDNECQVFEDGRTVIRDSVCQEDDLFPSVVNAVYAVRHVMEDALDDHEECIYADFLDKLNGYEDALVEIKAKSDGSDTVIYGYSSNSVYVKQLGVLESVSRDGFEFEELDFKELK